MAGYILERTWHESQNVTEEKDGSVRLVMEVAPGFELQSWIKGFLPHVTVVRPESLRKAIAQDLEAARADYEPPSG